ncbi:MAG: sigma-70 family RNA polymerase sigma factor, partial [Bacteroidota bacterium]
MVAILTRIFGLHHLDTIEDAVQDTFISAMRAWQGQLPNNPEAWLTQAAKNRTLDLFRKLSADDARIQRMQSGVETLPLQELFLDHEVEDSVLRMIFAACNPALDPKDQIAFSLKTISGFSQKEIAAYLLDDHKSLYGWQNYRLWNLMGQRGVASDELIAGAKKVL